MLYLTDTNLTTTSQEPSTLEKATWCVGSILTATASGTAWGAFIGWGIGAMVAAYQDPCDKEPNSYAVEKCSVVSAPAQLGAAVGAGIGAVTFGTAATASAFYSKADKEMSKLTMMLSPILPAALCCSNG